MKDTGIVRRIDELGRIVIPKEIRKNLRINTGDNVEIYMDENNKIVLKKYSTLFGMEEELFNIAKVVNEFSNATIIIADTDKIIVSYGKGSELYIDQYLDKSIIEEINLQAIIKKRNLCIVTGQIETRMCYIFPLFSRDLLHGLFILIENDRSLQNCDNEIGLYFKKFILPALSIFCSPW